MQLMHMPEEKRLNPNAESETLFFSMIELFVNDKKIIKCEILLFKIKYFATKCSLFSYTDNNLSKLFSFTSEIETICFVPMKSKVLRTRGDFIHKFHII